METLSEEKKLKRVKKRVKEIKGFYWHLALYVAVNLFMIINSIIAGHFEKDFKMWIFWTTLLGWGVGLAIHAWEVFGKEMVFDKRWEERKIKEYMAQEEKERNRFNR